MYMVLFPRPLEWRHTAKPPGGFSSQRAKTAWTPVPPRTPSCHKLSFQAQWLLPKPHRHTDSLFITCLKTASRPANPLIHNMRTLLGEKGLEYLNFSVQCPKKSKMLIYWWMRIRHTCLSAQLLVYQLKQLSKAHASHFSWFTLISIYAHTFSPSVTPCAPTQRWNWAPYLLHCSLNDTVPHGDEDASQDGYRRPKHSSGYQPATSVTASHGGVRFPPSDCTSVCLPACLPGSLFSFCLCVCGVCVLVFSACLCLCPGSSAGRLYHHRIWQSSQGQVKVQTLQGTSPKLCNIMTRKV